MRLRWWKRGGINLDPAIEISKPDPFDRWMNEDEFQDIRFGLSTNQGPVSMRWRVTVTAIDSTVVCLRFEATQEYNET